MDSSGSRQSPLIDFCEQGNEHPGSIKGQVREYSFLRPLCMVFIPTEMPVLYGPN
jgi:hypothetical protein